jgi:glycolate oxidase FAD binding subunit
MTPADVLATIQSALASGTPLEILGHGSKRRIGPPIATNGILDLSQMTGITLYEPEELVLSALAGTPVAEIESLLAKNGQQLAFEPMDYGPLFNGKPGRGTIGGILATNSSGPRRLKAGAARDHILGVEAVSGRGELFKSGGRVMKNVTGYDLSKGLAGSWGTLAVLTQVTFKVLPAAQTEQTLVLRGLDDAQAAAAMATAMGSSAEVSSAAHLPETVTGKVISGALSGPSSTLLRLEGFPASVAYRAEKLAQFLKSKTDILPEPDSRALWREIRDVHPFADGSSNPVWRVSAAPMAGHAILADFRQSAAADAFYDWQGGLIWIRCEGDPEAETLRALIKKHGGGHATLIRASEEQRRAIPVFEPQPPALADLAKRLKAQFDPMGILNPGRTSIG